MLSEAPSLGIMKGGMKDGERAGVAGGALTKTVTAQSIVACPADE